MASTFLTAEWRKLIMANYVVPEESLLPYLPAGTKLDLYEERCYVSLVSVSSSRMYGSNLSQSPSTEPSKKSTCVSTCSTPSQTANIGAGSSSLANWFLDSH
jgi:hypothetical protein